MAQRLHTVRGERARLPGKPKAGRHLLPLLGLLAVLAACDPPAAPVAMAQERSAPVLPATVNAQDFGDYVVYFNALTTVQLAPQIARRYGIARSRSRAMLNVSVMKKTGGSTGAAVTGKVSASAVNLAGDLKTLDMREIKEGSAVYYLAETSITDGETLIFTVDVLPEGESKPFIVRFKRAFFLD